MQITKGQKVKLIKKNNFFHKNSYNNYVKE